MTLHLEASTERKREETKLVRKHLVALSSLRLDGHRVCVVHRQTVGLFRQLHGEGRVDVGVNGMADIGGWFWGSGRGLQIETKSVSGVLEPDQISWRQMCADLNVFWLESRSVEYACEQVMLEAHRIARRLGEGFPF